MDYTFDDMNLSKATLRRTLGVLGVAGTAVVAGPAAGLGVVLCGTAGYAASNYQNIAHSCLNYFRSKGAEVGKAALQQGANAIRNRVSPEHQQAIQALINPNAQQALKPAAAEQIKDPLANFMNRSLGAVLPTAAAVAKVHRTLAPIIQNTDTAMQVAEQTGNALFNAGVSQLSEETIGRVLTTLDAFETIRNQSLSTSARQATKAFAHYAACRSMTAEQREEVSNAIAIGGTTLRAVKERYFPANQAGEASFIQWITQVATFKLAQIDNLVNDPDFNAKEEAKAMALAQAKRFSQWIQDVTGITDHRRNIADKKREVSNTLARVTALFTGISQADAAITTSANAGNALGPQQAPAGGGQATADMTDADAPVNNGQNPTIVADDETVPANPQGGILAIIDQLCASAEQAYGSGFANLLLGALGLGATSAVNKIRDIAKSVLVDPSEPDADEISTPDLLLRGLNVVKPLAAIGVQKAAQLTLDQVVSQPLQEKAKKTYDQLKDMVSPLFPEGVGEPDDSDSDLDDDTPLNLLERGVKLITSKVNNVLDYANGETSSSKDRSTAELLQRAKELIPPEVCTAEEEDYHQKSQDELNKTIELLTFKTIYRAFTGNGAQIDSFEEMVRLFETNNGKLTGDFETSVGIFLREIQDQMAHSHTPWYTALFINTIISPLISATVMSAAPRISKSFYNQVTEAIHLNASDDLNTTSLSTLKATTEICKKIDKSYIRANDPNHIENIRTSKDTSERIFELVNGTPEDQASLFKDATHAFIDLHYKDPIKFIDDIKACKTELKNTINRFNKSDVSVVKKLAIPIIAIGYVLTAVFEFLMTLFIKPLNIIINAIAKDIAIKNGFFEEIITTTIESLSGENNGNNTIVLDELFILILDEANKEIQDLIDDYSPEFDPLPALKKDEEKIAREFIQSILSTSSIFEDEESLEKRIEAIPIIGEKLAKLGLNKITLLLYNIYKKVTTKDQMEKYIAQGLEALNNNLRSDAPENVPAEIKRKNEAEAVTRQNTLERNINALGRRLLQLCVKVVNEPIHPPIDEFQKEYDSVLKKAHELEFSPEDLREENDKSTLQNNLTKIEETIKHLSEFIDDIKAIEDSPVHKKNPLRDQLNPITNAIVNMLELFSTKRKYYQSCLISAENTVEGKDKSDDEEAIEEKDIINDFLTQVQNLQEGEDLENQLITLAGSINSIKTTKNHKAYNSIKRNIQRLTALMVEKKYFSNSVDFYENLKVMLETFTLIETDPIIRQRLQDQITNYLNKHEFQKFLADENLVALLEGTDEYRKVEGYNSQSIFYTSSDEPHDITNDEDSKLCLQSEILKKLFDIYPNNRTSTADNAPEAENFLARRSALIKEFEDVSKIAQSTIDNKINTSIKQLLKEIRKHHKNYETFIDLKKSDESIEKFKEVYDEYLKAINEAKDKEIKKPSHEKTKLPRALAAMGLEEIESEAADTFTPQIQNILNLVKSSLFTTCATQKIVEGFFLSERNKSHA
ncbi:MAG: hypothetical protein S4CHLAM20_13770 [Chlamydiia bacterium]|nr:hypothetical protein [Chlamydiia bacterium]